MLEREFNTDDFDKRLGQIILMQRTRMGMSQKDLARVTGVCSQQIQKYESATNRILVGALQKIATVFEMSVGQLVDGATPVYMTDPVILNTVYLMYPKMTPEQREILNLVAKYMVGNGK